MPAQTIKDYLIGFGFDVDQSSTSAFQNIVKNTDTIVKGLANGLKSIVNPLQGVHQETKAVHQEAKQANVTVEKLGKGMKTLGQAMKVLFASAAAKKVYNFAKNLYEQEQTIAKTATTLHKTTEEARAYTTVLKVMGKTADEIKQSKALTETYNELNAIAKRLSLPEALVGSDNIKNVVGAFERLKVIGSYSLQWIYYQTQKVANGPLQRLKNIFDTIGTNLEEGMPEWTSNVAELINGVLAIVSAFAQAATDVVTFLNKIPGPIKAIIAALALLELALNGGTLGAVVTLIAGAGVLLDDFYTYMEGGDALLGPFWQQCIDTFTNIKSAVEDAITAIKGFYKESTSDDGKTNWLSFGVKLATYIIKGAGIVLKNFTTAIKTWMGLDENASWTEVGDAIIKGIGDKATELVKAVKTALTGNADASWTEVGDAIINGIKTVAGTLSSTLKEALGLGYDKSWPEIVSVLITGLQNGAGKLLDAIKTAITGDESSSWSDVGSALWGWISDSIKTAAGNITEFWKGILTDGLDRGGILGGLETILAKAMLLSLAIKTSIIKAIDKIQENGTLGNIWGSLESIVQSVLDIVNEIITAITGSDGTDGFAAFGDTLSNVVAGAVEVISAALSAAADALKWVAVILHKANEAGILDDVLKGIASSVGVIFAASAVTNVIKFFQAFAAGKAIFAGLNPYVLALATAVGGLIALISWAHDQVKREDKTVGDYKQLDLNQYEMVASQIDPKDGQAIGESLAEQINQGVEQGIMSSDTGEKLLEIYKQYLTPEGMDWESYYTDGGREAAEALLSGAEEVMDNTEIGAEQQNALDGIIESLTGAEEAAKSTSEELSNITPDDMGLSEMAAELSESSDAAADHAQQVTEALSTVETTGEEALTQVKAVSEETAAAVLDALSGVESPVSAVFESIKTLVDNTMNSIKRAPNGVSSRWRTAFNGVSNAVKNALKDLPTWVRTNVIDKITQALSSLPTTITTPTVTTGNSNGGVINSETVTRVGEGNKREYIIPVTKPNRGIPLLKAAARDLGLSVDSVSRATSMLGGSASGNVTPTYATTSSSSVVNNNYNNTINAPATINVRGTDPVSTGKNVNNTHEQLILRNIKSAMA